ARVTSLVGALHARAPGVRSGGAGALVMTTDLRLGMIGAGWIADRHLQSVSELPQVSVVAVADLDRARAERVASAAGAAVHDEWRSMLEQEQMDAVMVLTPPLA